MNITPSVGQLTVTTYGAATIITPAAGSIAVVDPNLTGPIQTLTLPPPSNAFLALTGYAPLLPAVNTLITPAATSLAWTSYGPTQATFALPGAGSVALSGAAPTQGIEITPAAGSLALINGIPQIQGRYTLQPPTGILALAGSAPALVGSNTITPAASSIGITGQPATATGGTEVIVSPPAAPLALTGAAPTLGVGSFIQGASLAFTSHVPAVALGAVLTIPAGSVALAGNVPAPLQGFEIIPGTGSVGLFGGVAQLPGGPFAVAPPTGGLQLTGNVPTQSIEITPAAGSLSITDQPPVVLLFVRPPSAALSLTAYAPQVVASVSPGTAPLALTGYAPTVLSPNAGPAAGWLAFAGLPPSVTVSSYSVREQILQALANSLSAATGVPAFVRSRLAPVARQEGTFVTLAPVRDEVTYRGPAFTRHVLLVQITITAREGLGADGAAVIVPDQQCDDIVAAVHAAISADPTLGGLAALNISLVTSFTFTLADANAVVCESLYKVSYATVTRSLTELA